MASLRMSPSPNSHKKIMHRSRPPPTRKHDARPESFAGRLAPSGRTHPGGRHETDPLGRPCAVARGRVPGVGLRAPGPGQVLGLERLGAGVRPVALPGLVPYPDRRHRGRGGTSLADASHRLDRSRHDRRRHARRHGDPRVHRPPAPGDERGASPHPVARGALRPVAALRPMGIPTAESGRSMTENLVADLVRRARDSRASIREQHAAFAMLVERFEEMAFATALVACGDAETARDACQEAFVVAWRKLPALREPAAFGGWLKRLVRTQCLRARRRGTSAESRTGELPAASKDACDAAEIVASREVEALVRSEVLRLPPSEREAVLLFYFLGESLQAVARALGVTAGRAGRLVYDARLRLRKSLPRSVTEAFLVGAPTPSFARRVRDGMLDEL